MRYIVVVHFNGVLVDRDSWSPTNLEVKTYLSSICPAGRFMVFGNLNILRCQHPVNILLKVSLQQIRLGTTACKISALQSVTAVCPVVESQSVSRLYTPSPNTVRYRTFLFRNCRRISHF